MAYRRPVSFLGNLIKSYQTLWIPQMKNPPYHHVCRIGNPVLRRKCEPVDPNKIDTPEVNKVIDVMIKVMRRTNSFGLAAPQVGCPLQIFIAEFPEKLMNMVTKRFADAREFQSFPLKVFINPKMTVINNKQIKFHEGCTCLPGFTAVVPRFHEVKIEALDSKGRCFEWQVKGWAARIVQHEMDHLEGKLYVDIMDSLTFENNKWIEAELGLLQKLSLVYR